MSQEFGKAHTSGGFVLGISEQPRVSRKALLEKDTQYQLLLPA